MYGGDNFRQSQFNLAVQGERQPGSSFKPFVLATALKQGVSPTTIFPSRPVSIFIGDKYWPVHNYENSYLGSANLTTATVVSDNTVYAQLTQLVGPKNVAATARQLGITRQLNPYFAIGLGADPVSPLEMARAFSTFANDGRRIDGSIFGDHPRAIARISNPEGKVVDDNRPINRRILTPDENALLTSILEGVIQSGTGRRAALPDRTVAGKTGTTENYGDAWFVGYTPQLATAVWVGYPNRLKPMLTEYHGQPVAGGTFPAEIWNRFSRLALAGTTPESFPGYAYRAAAAKRVVWRDGSLELDNGYCRVTELVTYFAGHGPARTANCKPNEVDVPRVVGMSLARAKVRLALQPLTRQRRLQARRGEAASRSRARPVPAQRPALVARHGDARAREAAARHRPQGDRAIALRGPAKAPRPRTGAGDRAVCRRPLGPDRGADAGRRGRRGAAAEDQADRRARLSGGEPVARGRPAEKRRPGLQVTPDTSVACVMPIRGPVEISGLSVRSVSRKGGASRARPSCSPVIASAWHSFPGPEQSARSAVTRRRRCCASIPAVGSSARINTASASSSPPPQTRFRHQWIPYER